MPTNSPSKYNTIGIGYNDTRKADPYLSSRMLALLELTPGDTCLDVGAGTGNYTRKVFEAGHPMIAVEPSDEMLRTARQTEPRIDWRQGTAEALPIDSESVHGALASLTIHHWHDIQVGFREVFRVLKPGGRFVLLVCTPEAMEGYWLKHYFPQMIEDSQAQLPGKDVTLDALQQAGFSDLITEPYNVRPDLEDLFLMAGKDRPELYFDADVRKGISSFSALSNQEEVVQGLVQLRINLANGSHQAIADRYQNPEGDYLFIAARKPID